MFKEVKECRCCGSDDLYWYLDLGQQPLSNSYHKGEELETFPLEINVCNECFHSQLSVVVEPHLMFKNYLYVSGTTRTFRQHCWELARDAVEYWFHHGGIKQPITSVMSPRVLDIACNDGTLLEYFQELDCNIQGVDPAENLRELTIEKGIPVEVGYWGSGVHERLEGEFDIITGTNVFAHVDEINEFLVQATKVLNEDGIIILEFPYCDNMISDCEFDTIYHEHLSYFLVNSFKKNVETKGLGIVRILRTPIHGGSIRFFLKMGERHCLEAYHLVEDEEKKGLLKKETYAKFSRQVSKNKGKMRKLVTDLKSSGKTVIGYGASAKGNTMLNYFGLDLDYIVDDNEMKWGYLTPGRNILIKSPEAMKEEDELYIVILAWNFFDEIAGKIEEITGKKHHYIRYVPEVSCT